MIQNNQKRKYLKHGLKNHRLYDFWKSMVTRCKTNRYIEKNTTICERWMDVAKFIEDMYPSYQEGLSLDRINNDGNYEPSNCRWTTQMVQSRNTRILNSRNTSGYRGVRKNGKGWMARIYVNYYLQYIGTFKSKIEAAQAYDKYVIDNNLEHTKNFN